jgi:hypothetical protein
MMENFETAGIGQIGAAANDRLSHGAKIMYRAAKPHPLIDVAVRKINANAHILSQRSWLFLDLRPATKLVVATRSMGVNRWSQNLVTKEKRTRLTAEILAPGRIPR